VATLKQYGRTLWDLQQTVCNRIGFDIRRAPSDQRAVLIAVDASFALILKALVDKGVFTDTELNAAVQAVRNTTFKPLETPPVNGPDDVPGTALPFPDPLQD
jgi:hypothetical protein